MPQSVLGPATAAERSHQQADEQGEKRADARAVRVNDALRNSLVIEVRDLVAENKSSSNAGPLELALSEF